jgi:hypothetical protein
MRLNRRQTQCIPVLTTVDRANNRLRSIETLLQAVDDYCFFHPLALGTQKQKKTKKKIV